jgi:NAD-dependent deacetylase
MDKIAKLIEIINESDNIVLFTGAGISTASNIPDFRSANGIYSELYKGIISPEEAVSHTFFIDAPNEFFDFYFKKMVYLDAKPNIAHKFFAKLEQEGKLKAVVTRNINDLHQMAGSKNVIELHGSIKRNYCTKCHKFYSVDEIYNKIPPRCSCGAIIKPDVVLYEEGLNEKDIVDAITYISNCDTLIVVGTSLMVYPAAGFLRYFKGRNLVLINKTKTSYDNIATLVINDDIIKIIEEYQIKLN